jgi:hypothetical protein
MSIDRILAVFTENILPSVPANDYIRERTENGQVYLYVDLVLLTRLLKTKIENITGWLATFGYKQVNHRYLCGPAVPPLLDNRFTRFRPPVNK